MSRFASLMDKVIRVGDGRGFVVECRDRSLVITASHCLPHLPPRHPAAHMHERMHRNLLGRLGSELTVWTEVLFVDPVADIAVLGEPDGQELFDECEAYFQLCPTNRFIWQTHNAFRLTSATSGGGDEHVANDDNDGRNADSDDGRNSDSDDADSMDNTRTHSMTADSTDSIRTDGTGSNRIRSTGNVGLC